VVVALAGDLEQALRILKYGAGADNTRALRRRRYFVSPSELRRKTLRIARTKQRAATRKELTYIKRTS